MHRQLREFNSVRSVIRNSSIANKVQAKIAVQTPQKMVDIDQSRKSKKRKDFERFDDIASAIESYLDECKITTSQYAAQANHMKVIEVSFCSLKFDK